ncbi:flavin monoamine oxidase family protein [Nocardioides sp. AX2bis]|uniref:flavin monoamine oxidase family protein n=1 Tax=Nocardioides sp. AX2bis TaxID=2653157 RepID=UPI0012EEE2B5|nr:FAD-dependent oxidoreductase [Nocardioides sp. AX2bis]VXC50975.1 conserved hypothetical protein [Nocardioides sp. AX2bis]
MSDTDVVVVGAGLAGLRCARALVDRGHDVVVLERDDAVGGRIRTDRVDGFALDRGFQLLNPAYRAVRRWVDVDALGLQPFAAGVAARGEEGLVRLGNPLAAPSLLLPSVRAVVPRPREVLAAARWAAPLLRARPGRRLAASLTTASRRPDVSRREALDRAGVDGLLRATLDAFFAGVVLEDDGSTSQAYALLLTATFLAGTPALPERGMQALPEQLAGPLGDRVRLGTGVDAVETVAGGAVVHTGGTTLRARQVVVAVAGQDAGALTGALTGDPGGSGAGVRPRTKGVVTSWFAADEAPTDSHLLFVDGRSRPSGPLVNTAVVSNPAPSYAPAGQHLVQASALLGPDRPVPTEDDVRRHAGELLGADPRGWRLLRRHEVPHALPAQPAPLSLRRPVRVRDHLVVCGDHRDTASIQGALVSGQRAALDVAAALAR